MLRRECPACSKASFFIENKRLVDLTVSAVELQYSAVLRHIENDMFTAPSPNYIHLYILLGILQVREAGRLKYSGSQRHPQWHRAVIHLQYLALHINMPF